MAEPRTPPMSAERLATLVEEKVKRKAWEEGANFGGNLPSELDPAWIPVCDEIAFCAGLAKRPKQAVKLYERAWAVDPDNWRRASALAYLYYEAALGRRKEDTYQRGRRRDVSAKRTPKPFEDLAELRDGFRKWIGIALTLRPDSVKDLYRLGMFESQVESRKDKVAFRVFLRALEAWDGLPAHLKERGDMRKYRSRILFAGGRSALRLGKLAWARKLSFQCIREDGGGVARVFQLALGGKVCLAMKDSESAERAFRLALDAEGPRSRDFLYGDLAQSLRDRRRLEDAVEVIDRNVPAARRPSYLWRFMGDLYVEQGDLERAEPCFEASLLKDRMGRHLTFERLGRLARRKGDLPAAERAFRKAQESRRKQYHSDDRAALTGLLEVLEARGKSEEAAKVAERLAALGDAPGGGRGTPSPECDDLRRAEV